MASREQLDAAHYVHRGEDGDYLENVGQCGFGCDFSHLVWKDEEHSEAAYRYCDKFRMRVETYDSCDLFDDKRQMQLFSDLVSAMHSGKQTDDEKKASNSGGVGWFVFLFIACAVLVLWLASQH